MKKFIFAMTAVTVVMAGVAAASGVNRKPTPEEVDLAIDSRLHAMLVKLNAEKK